MTPTILWIGIFIYVASILHCLPLVYCEYVTDGSYLWIVWLLTSFIPIINTLYYTSHTFSYINYLTGDYNPLSDALSVRNNMNLKIHCKECDTRFRKWEGIHELTDTGVKTKCHKCSNSEDIEIISDNEEFIGSLPLSLHSAVTLNRFLLIEQRRNRKVQEGV